MEISNEDLTAIIRTAIEGAAVDRIVKEAKTNIDSTIYPGGLSPADVEVRLADLEARNPAGGGGSVDLPMPFAIDDGKITDCRITVGRHYLACSDTTLPALADGVTPSGYIYAKVTYANSSMSLSVVHSSEELMSTLTIAYRLLYLASAGAWKDCRLMPVIVAAD